jgi:phosphatidylglycerophosphate synthase
LSSVRDSELDAVVLAEDPLAGRRIAGLTARERAVRVARKVGAARVFVVENAKERGQLVAWRAERDCSLLVIRADQLVHTPLVQPLVEDRRTAVAVVSEKPPVEDLTPGSYAGAMLATDSNAARVIGELARGDSDAAIAATIATKIPHGAIARAPIATPAQRRAAHELLYRILVKPQDNAITRYLYRPVSFPLTRLLVWTPITPNQISYIVAAMVAFGCWMTAHASHTWALAGTAVVLAASYLDCCDGEVARVKLMSSRLGAWIDTIVDELSSVGYMAAIGWHCHLVFGPSFFGAPPFDPWVAAIWITLATYVWSIYCIYYNIIVAVGSANSQDYVGRFEIVPGGKPNTVRLQPAAAKAIAPTKALPPPLAFAAKYAPYLVRRDLISWATLLFAALHWTHVAFGLFALGGVVTFVIVTIDHVRLRSLRRSAERRGLVFETP